MRRRDFIKGIAGATMVWPAVVRAQQRTMPVVGCLISGSQTGYEGYMGAVRKGLGEIGYVEGGNLAIEYRWGDYHYDRLPTLAAELVSRQVDLIFTTGSVVSAVAAKSATNTIPIVFANGSDPIKYGLVASLNRPGGNVTGVSYFNSELGPKRIELLRQIVPNAVTIGLLVNPTNPNAADDSKEIQEVGQRIDVRIEVFTATDEHELDEAFAKIAQLRADALMVHVDALFNAQYKRIVALAEQYAVPTMYAIEQAPEAGGLMSYGPHVSEMNRQAGTYIGRILKGTNPADLPVLLPTKFDLIVNLKTAKKLGLTVPMIVQMTADEVIE
jgi:putative tryptophan/tyrosine transport system substrate-binding protein